MQIEIIFSQVFSMVAHIQKAGVQKEVPMILWLSNSLEERLKLDTTCFRKVLDKEASHDNLYSSLLGLLDVKSTTYDKSLDFTSQCRKED